MFKWSLLYYKIYKIFIKRGSCCFVAAYLRYIEYYIYIFFVYVYVYVCVCVCVCVCVYCAFVGMNNKSPTSDV